MSPHLNELGQPTGSPLPNWTARPWPPRLVTEGRTCWLEPLDYDRHAAQLFEANSLDREGAMWTYLPFGPFESFEDYGRWLKGASAGEDPQFYAVVDKQTGHAIGVASLMRISPKDGVIEVGCLTYSPLLQKTPMATEFMYLLMRRAFDELGYRRYEWKCDSLNQPSRAAAIRLGFQFEGIFRQATIYKGRTRDTAWFSIIDSEWPVVKAAFERWLDPANFDEAGRQIRSLSSLRG